MSDEDEADYDSVDGGDSKEQYASPWATGLCCFWPCCTVEGMS